MNNSSTTTTTFIQPPVDGSLDVSGIIDFHRTTPNLTAAYSFANEDGSIVDISHFEFARAAHRVAHWLRPGRQGPEGQVVGIVALTDSLLYQTLTTGCMIAGLIPFPISHRNSNAAFVHLLTSTQIHRLLTTHGSLARLVDGLKEELTTQHASYQLSIEEIPLVSTIYPFLGHETPTDAFTPYPSAGRLPDLHTTALYLHSSGSTGLPKPIPLSHLSVTTFGALPVFRDLAALSPRLATGALPAFHAMALFIQFLAPLFCGITACLYPPLSMTEYRVPVSATPQNALEQAKRARVDGVITVPAFLLEWAEREEDVRYLKGLKLVPFSGGPLATRVGDHLVEQGVQLTPIYGGTEFGAGNTLLTEGRLPSEWMWMPMYDNIRWQPQNDGLFEAQFLTTKTHQLAVENLPDGDVKGYATKDLFERHPTKPHLYRIVGRLDDVLIMANGEKTVPGPMEDIITASPLVAGAVMFGRERNQVGVLIEPARPVAPESVPEFRNAIWGVVEDANALAPAFAKLYKEMILVVTDPEKMMVRAPKGTVVKKATVKLYEKEIVELYDTIEASTSAPSDVAPPPSFTAPDLAPWLLAHAEKLSDKRIDPQRDLFDQGFDSLNATFLRHRIVGALRGAGPDKAGVAQQISQNIVYTYSSIGALARAVEGLVAGKQDGVVGDDARKAVEDMIAKYSASFAPARARSNSGKAVILLTGSTGGLGSHILDILLRNDAVQRVYAFNRPGRTPISQRQEAGFADRGLDVRVLASDKLVYLEGDSSRQDLGLSDQLFEELSQSLTVVIHNAWALDFNKSLATFEPHVRGTRNLVNLALAAGAKFLFTSSIASGQNWDQSKGPFPEEMQLEASVALSNGYGEGKYAAERVSSFSSYFYPSVIDRFVIWQIIAASGLRATSFRIGQVSGSSSNGSWATTDWVPAIVKSSLALGSFPSDPASTAAWILPEAVSQAIVDVALLPPESEQPFALNLVHPRPIAWDAIFSVLAGTAKMPLIPIAQWVSQVEKLARNASGEDLERFPAIKLVEFLKAALAGAVNVPFATEKAQAVSSAMKDLRQLEDADVRRWIGYWNQAGFIDVQL
ncbi:Acetyl-CoA synthetase-like protein [Mycena chlorophos]|uniref:Acetyl-CoA synthetase-like protein n=1 Tax=Mycena chlorophos TaxID=658473 RepID=A0A8H6S6P3_MYCCL|nr:Acetyl-CoA synthetase-like protein [Mycena chlorophos]